jgi:hypothetical protein
MVSSKMLGGGGGVVSEAEEWKHASNKGCEMF